MQVQQTALVALLVALGFKTAGKWPVEKLRAKIEKIDSLTEEGEEPEDAADAKLFKKLVKAQKAGEAIEIVSGDGGEEEEDDSKKPVKSKVSGKSKKKADPDEDEEPGDEEPGDDEAAEKPKKKGKGEPTPKGQGVIATIVEILQAASKKNPATKKDIHEKLVKKFPDRAPDSMWSTINIQIPNRLKADKGLDVQKNENGYWIA